MEIQIPGYTIISQIGDGGMATVYLAYQQSLERRVALKVLSAERAADPAFGERFARESQIGASLFHRNIVPVYDGGRFNTSHYLVMEYLPNGNFKHRLEKGCDTGAALKIIYEVASALAYVHSKSYIHRDIKPDNILFREDQSAVVTDFGIALDIATNTRGKPASRQIVGSPQYMSPEQARGEALDFRADIYSLGAVLYEALAGKPLFESPATVADAVRHSRDPVPLLPAGVSWLQPLLERMLAKDRDARFASMEEVIKALEPCLAVPTFGWGIPLHGHPALERPAQRPASSTPTLIDEASAEPPSPRSEPPPTPAPITAPPSSMAASEPPRQSRAGLLLLLLALAALPFAVRHWSSLSATFGVRTADTPKTPVVVVPDAVLNPELPPQADALKQPPVNAITIAPPKVQPDKPLAMATPVVKEQHPSQPANETPYERYSDMLSHDPDSQEARDGLTMVAIHYLDLSSKALNQDNLNGAQQYVDEASAIATRYRLGSGLSEKIANQQYMLNRIRYLDTHKGPAGPGE